MSYVDKRESPNHSERGGARPRMVVIHADAGKTEAGTISWIMNPEAKVSYHYLIGRDGTVYQLVSEELKAWHAGESSWHGMTVGNSVNPTSIGVAFANDGTEAYRDAQYEAGGHLVAEICKRYGIPLDLIRGHNEVSPGRKRDPFPQFSWEKFYGLLGLYFTGRAA